MAKAKNIEGLDCSADALEGAAKVLRVRFKEIADLYQNSSDLSDIDLIHDLRVATRRLRSALRDFMPLLEKESFNSIKKELKKISDALGKVRDEDVAIVALEELQNEAESEEIKEEIKFFLQLWNDSRERARADLAEIFTIEIIDELEKHLAAKLDKHSHSENSIEFKEFGKNVIKKNLQKFEDLTSSLYTPFETENLHQLRLRAKRLRYAMKIFAVCLEDEAKEFAKKISKMQTFLGDTHDCDEWIESLLSILREQDDSLDQNKRDALIWLTAKFSERRTQNYTSALKLWSDWKSEYFLARLKAMTL
jgi:CHAD domain-containing protein